MMKWLIMKFIIISHLKLYHIFHIHLILNLKFELVIIIIHNDSGNLMFKTIIIIINIYIFLKKLKQIIKEKKKKENKKI